MAFDKNKHLIKVQGNREYLPVSARLIWFREEHPDWGIVTSPIEINLEKQYAIFSASIFNAEGKLMATATKMENVRGFGDYLEKAETGAVGRALAYCGFGTQFAPELEEGGRLADAPYPMGGGGNRFAGAGPRMNGPAGGGFNNGGTGNNRPAPPRPAPAPPPSVEREPVSDSDGDVFEDEGPRPAPAERHTPPAAARPATPAQPITRVREPERDDFDPGGSDEDEEDPFAEDNEPAAAAPVAAARPTAPPARAAAARAGGAAAAAPPPANGDGGTSEASSPTTITGNRCSVEGCPAVLTQGQINMSTTKFGKALCPLHQRDATPVGAAGGAPTRRGGGGAAAKPEPADTLL